MNSLFILGTLVLHSYMCDLIDFYQDDYDMTLDIAEVTYFDKNYFEKARVGFDLYNRTHRAYNADFVLIKNLHSDLMISWQMYKMLSNEYRFFPATAKYNVCEVDTSTSSSLKQKVSGLSNMPFCNIKEGTYWIRNLIPDFSTFPPHMPRGKYKMVAKNLYHNKNILETHLYATIKDKKFM